ncbi:carboxymuconolactone decarboxylase family protein [Paenibacillus rhizophilus]|uniref:carboxymuconolactone decarboxylase family protein n=1 Tax=Paenibacillus rhizophilus TaxID=1850366 RepID=UPI001FEA797B|nr:carboxymuconolactone decarboxylase family protein [Paenibacillus rhizophilus]
MLAKYATDSDFQDILCRFIFGEVFDQVSLDINQRKLITLIVIVTSQTLPQLKAHARTALSSGLTPVEMQVP